MPSSRGAFQPRDWTLVSLIEGRFFIIWATRQNQEHWSGQPVPSSGDLPNPGIELGSPSLQADIILYCFIYFGIHWWLSNKELACEAGDKYSIPVWGRSPGGGRGNLLQYSCLENPIHRGTWRATVYEVAKSGTHLQKQHAHALYIILGLCFNSESHFIFIFNPLPFSHFIFMFIFLVLKVKENFT